MSLSRHRGVREELDPFTDLLFNALLGFTLLFFITLLFLHPPAKSGILDPKAEYLITATWPDGSVDDIDLWVQGPDGARVWYREPEAGLMTLDRDDRGMEGDVLVVEGQRIENPLNQEIVTVRGTVPGEYIVNLQYYESRSGGAVPVTVSVSRINPQLEVVFYEQIELATMGEERTAIRYTVDSRGAVVNLSRLQKSLRATND